MQIKHIRAQWFGSDVFGYSCRLDTITPKGQMHVALMSRVNAGAKPEEFTVSVFKECIDTLNAALRQRGIDVESCFAPDDMETCPPLSDDVAKAFTEAMAL